MKIMDIFNNRIVLITCGRGIVPYLRKEVRRLGFEIRSDHDTGVEVDASFDDTAKLNLYLRTGLHVMYRLKKFTCRSPRELYIEIKSLPWEDIISPSEYLSIVSVTDTPHINNSMFASQKVKDAIVDRMMEKCGARPDSGPERDNVVINFFWKEDRSWIYLDTSGNKLSDRGYRKIPHTAPLQETLAASLLLASGYKGSMPLVNPMCGGGTLAIEAALIALHKAPGLLRDNFGLMHLKNFDATKWQALRQEIEARTLSSLRLRIISSDIDERAVEIARKNAQSAGVDKLIEFYVCDFADTPLPEEKGIIILNPEYGKRMGKNKELGQTYRRIGDFFKQKCSGFTGYVFTGNEALSKEIGLHPARRMEFSNARIPCRFLEYPLYEGSKKRISDKGNISPLSGGKHPL